LKSFLKYQFPPILWLGFIFLISSWSALGNLKTPTGFDKLTHLVLWFVLCLLTRRAFFYQQRLPWLKRHNLWGALVVTTLIGVADEYYQIYVPSRTSDFGDVVADFAGAFLFVIIVLTRNRRQERLAKKDV
jgi:VanZ family protein